MYDFILGIVIGIVIGILIFSIFQFVYEKKQMTLDVIIYVALCIIIVILYLGFIVFDWSNFKLNLISELIGIIISSFIIARIVNYRFVMAKKKESIEISDQILGNCSMIDLILQQFLSNYLDSEEKSWREKYDNIEKWKNEIYELQLKLRNYQYIFDNKLLLPEVREELRWLDSQLSGFREDLDEYTNSTNQREHAWSHRGLYLSLRNINASIVELFSIYGRQHVMPPDSTTADYINDFKEVTNKILKEHGYEHKLL